MRAPDWLTARPVAHRGLHDISRGIVENMPGAFAAAIEGNLHTARSAGPIFDGSRDMISIIRCAVSLDFCQNASTSRTGMIQLF